mgnify:CR=1 FL=1
MRLSNLINAVDLHACGEPGRVITGGVLDATGTFSVSVVPYLLAPGAANVPLHLQAAVADFGAGQWRLSNAETRIFRN